MLLVVARHGVKPIDLEIIEGLDRAVVVNQIALTKSDVLNPSILAERVTETQSVIAKHAAAHPVVIATSAETGLGLDLLRAEIAALA